MKKATFLTTLIAGTLIAGVFSSPAFAYESPCQQVYGGGVNCPPGNLIVNKTVMNPQNNMFVDNLGVNDPTFTPGQTVTFHIAVSNNGGTALSPVTVKDIFPQFISFVSGPGKFDANTKTLTTTIDNINAGETKTLEVKGKVANDTDLPSNQSVTCVINTASATNDNKTSTDNAQFCIGRQTTKGGLPIFPAPKVTTTPPTGPEAFSLLGLIPTAAAGLFLKKRSR